MTNDTRTALPPTGGRELTDAELEAVAAGKMRGVAGESTGVDRNPVTGGARTTTSSFYQRFRGFRPGIG
jgi:hypothetical protein